ncbi:hypothetical protein BA065_02640, partial [Nanoarchaeota archaeon NZ13-N]
NYKFVSHSNIKRLISIIKLNNRVKINKITYLAKKISKTLDSNLIKSYIIYFPSKDLNKKDFTYIAIISSSHIVISSYSEDDSLYLDIDVAWCSDKIINPNDMAELLKETFGKDLRKILTIKIYDYLGNMMMAFSPDGMMIAEFSE